MFDKLHINILKSIAHKMVKDQGLELDDHIGFDFHFSDKNILTIKYRVAFQIMTKNDEVESIEWRLRPFENELSALGIFKAINDNNFDLLYDKLKNKFTMFHPIESIKNRLNKDETLKI